MSDHESVSSSDSDRKDEELDLHSEVSSDGNITAGESYQPESSSDLEEDGFDVATHGGGRLENVANFNSSHALTEGFSILDDGEATAIAHLAPAHQGEYEQPESVCSRDDRVRMSPTTAIPWRMVCQLIITKADGSKSGCTGWFIGPRTVMTAGHCVYSHSGGGWAKKIEVIPGMDAAVKPYGSQVGTSFRSVKGWTKNKKLTHDYGCIILPNETLGRRIGWFGFASLSQKSLKNLLINNSGYASDKQPSSTQWFNAGRITKVESQRLQYMIDTYNGHSGSPVWRYREGKRHAVGVHAYGGCPNKATRITRPVFDNMKNWKSV